MKRSKVHVATTPIDSPMRVAYRFVSGQDLNGGYKTDHKWTKPGTKITSVNGRATRWAHQPMRRRAGIRALGATALLCLLIGPLISVAGTLQTLRVLAWVALAAGGWVVYERARKYAHRREVIAPLAQALAQRLGDARYIHDPRSWIEVPVDVEDGTTIVYLPVETVLSEIQERALAKMVGRKVGLLHPSHNFIMQGERPRLELVPAPAPRDLVSFTDPDVRALVASASEGTLFLGLGPRDLPCFLDLNTQAPHIGMSISTNGGKSTTGRGALMQHLHNGGIALVLDPKMDSQLWARELPNVRYADTAQEIHEALLWLSRELDRRSRVTKQYADIRGDVDPALVGPRLMVMAEEVNTLEIDVAAYWRTIRDPRNDPIKPVSLAALGRALNMGRARRINAFIIAQELLVQSIGGPAAKTNLSTRILGRANTPTWNKLAPECKVNGRYPKKSMHRGRVYLVTGEEPVAVQTMYADEQDAIDYVLSGTVVAFPSEGGSEGGTPAQARDHIGTNARGSLMPHVFEDDDDLAEPDALAEQTVEDDDLVTLVEAHEILALSIKTLRNARDRDKRFPDPEPSSVAPGKASKYHLPDIEKWALNRASGRGGDAA
jgi:hypothetical protein